MEAGGGRPLLPLARGLARRLRPGAVLRRQVPQVRPHTIAHYSVTALLLHKLRE